MQQEQEPVDQGGQTPLQSAGCHGGRKERGPTGRRPGCIRTKNASRIIAPLPLSCQDFMMLGELVLHKAFVPDVLEATHEGYPGLESMLRCDAFLLRHSGTVY